MIVTTLSIVEDLDVIENIGTCEVACLINAFSDVFLSQAAEKDSATALVQQFPRRLMLGGQLSVEIRGQDDIW